MREQDQVLPTAKQVTSHAEQYPLPGGGGAWLYREDGWLCLEIKAFLAVLLGRHEQGMT